MIEFKNVTKKFESLLVLDEINFSIEKGSFVSIVGPSGCGKTTTLRMIAGLSNPTSGDILICQKSPKEMLKEKILWLCIPRLNAFRMEKCER